jgi:3-mercaptopyruvate sulfurtransferase SseA
VSARPWIGAACAALAALAPAEARAQWPPWLAKDEPPPRYPAILVTAESLATGDFVVLDVREPALREREPVPGSVAVSPSDLDPSNVAARLAPRGITGRERLVCAGAADDPVRTAQLFWLLEAAGCPDVRVLAGAPPARSAEGGAGSGPGSTRPPARWSVVVDTSRIASADQVAARFGRPDPARPDLEILDARPEAEWAGTGDPAGGHVPHSLPVDVAAFLGPEGRFASPESIRARLDRLGPRPATTVDLSSEFVTLDDGTSTAGALAYLALRLAGVERARHLPGGFAEWKARGLPRVRVVAQPEVAALLADARAGSRDVVLVDVRGAADFAAVRIPGAIWVSASHLADSLGAALARERPGLDRARAAFVTYCYGEDCIRSRNAATVAARQGFLEPLWFRGGIPEWIRMGGEVVRGDAADDGPDGGAAR